MGARRDQSSVDARATELVVKLDDQRRLVRAVLELATKQRAAIERDEPAELLRVVAERERAFVSIEANTKKIEELRSVDDPVACGSEPIRALLETRLRELAELAADVAERDRVDVQSAEQLRDRAAAELAAVSRGRKMNGAYGTGDAPAVAAFQDREG